VAVIVVAEAEACRRTYLSRPHRCPRSRLDRGEEPRRHPSRSRQLPRAVRASPSPRSSRPRKQSRPRKRPARARPSLSLSQSLSRGLRNRGNRGNRAPRHRGRAKPRDPAGRQL